MRLKHKPWGEKIIQENTTRKLNSIRSSNVYLKKFARSKTENVSGYQQSSSNDA